MNEYRQTKLLNPCFSSRNRTYVCICLHTEYAPQLMIEFIKYTVFVRSKVPSKLGSGGYLPCDTERDFRWPNLKGVLSFQAATIVMVKQTKRCFPCETSERIIGLLLGSIIVEKSPLYYRTSISDRLVKKTFNRVVFNNTMSIKLKLCLKNGHNKDYTKLIRSG